MFNNPTGDAIRVHRSLQQVIKIERVYNISYIGTPVDIDANLI